MASTAWLEWCEQKTPAAAREPSELLRSLRTVTPSGLSNAFHVACRCRVPVYLDDDVSRAAFCGC